jgi:hypothetical protein
MLLLHGSVSSSSQLGVLVVSVVLVVGSVLPDVSRKRVDRYAGRDVGRNRRIVGNDRVYLPFEGEDDDCKS